MPKNNPKKKKGGGTPAAPAAPTTNAPFTWEMLRPPYRPSEDPSSRLESDLAKLLASSSKPRSDQPWGLSIRRARIWLSDLERPVRPWWISFIVPERRWVGSLLLENWEASGVSPHPLSCAMVKVGLVAAIKHAGCSPPALVLWPGAEGSFRAASLLAFAPQLAEALRDTPRCRVALRTIPVVEATDEAAPGSLKRVNLERVGANPSSSSSGGGGGGDEEDEVGPEVMERMLRVFLAEGAPQGFLEQQLQRCERPLNERRGISALLSSTVPSLAAPHHGLSIACLRLVYRAARVFHDVRPWRGITNHHPLLVTVPCSSSQPSDKSSSAGGAGAGAAAAAAAASNRTFVVVVAGNGSWNSRGAYFYDTWEEMLRFGRREAVPHSVLQFTSRGEAPFQTLDHVEELGLEVSETGASYGSPAAAEDGYPVLFHSRQAVALGRGSDLYYYRDLWSTPPPLADLEPLALATLAVARYSQMETLVKVTEAERSDPFSRTKTSFAMGRHAIDIDELVAAGSSSSSSSSSSSAGAGAGSGSGGHRWQRRVLIEMRQLNPSYENSLSEEEITHDMQKLVGMKDLCNFCQKPKELTESGKLRKCSRCQKVNYCSVECQRRDWKRHRKQECTAAAAD